MLGISTLWKWFGRAEKLPCIENNIFADSTGLKED